MRDFIYKALRESVNNENISLEEKLPIEVARAYKNYGEDINQQATEEDRGTIPDLSMMRWHVTHDLGKANYEEISKEEALKLIKDKSNLNSNLSKMIFIFDLGSNVSESRRYKMVRYNDKGNQIIRVDFKSYDKDIYYENSSGKKIYKTASWPLKALIEKSSKIFITDDKNFRIADWNRENPKDNPEANREDKDLAYDSSEWTREYPFRYLDSTGKPYLKYDSPSTQKRYLRRLGYGEEDTGNHEKIASFDKYLKVSGDYAATYYRKYLRKLKDFEDTYLKGSGYEEDALGDLPPGLIEIYEPILDNVKYYKEEAKRFFNKKNNSENNYPLDKNFKLDSFFAQANLKKLRSMQHALKSMEKDVDAIKSNNKYFNNYSKAMVALQTLNDKKAELEKKLLEVENNIRDTNNSYTSEEKREYEAEIENKIDSLLDKCEKYAETISEMKKKYLKEDVEGIQLLITDEETHLSKEDIDFLIKDEEEAIEGYQKALTKTTCEYEIEVLNHIIDEEREHIEELKGILSGKSIYIVEGNKKEKTKKDKPIDTYMYKGPIYRFNKIVSYEWEGTTKAVSEKQALNNLRYQAGAYLGLDVGSHKIKIDLDPDFLTKIENEEDYFEDILENDDVKFCDECGNRLTDGGSCPVCDHGEEDI